MKTIKVFLASSEELRSERLELKEMISKLNKNAYNKKGINIEMFTWEEHSTQLRTEDKQEEYNEYARSSDMFLGIFWTKAGRFTLEEFNVALKHYKETKKSPAMFIFFKETENEELTLKEFKERIFDRESGEGHYATNFTSVDRVQCEFMMEFLRLEADGEFRSLAMDGTKITLDGYEVCDITVMPFAFNNDRRKDLIEQIAKLKRFIEKNRDDDDEDMVDDVREKRNKLTELEEELVRMDEALLNMSIDFARRLSTESSEKFKEIYEAFQRGDMNRVDELTDLDKTREVLAAKRETDKAARSEYESLLISRNSIITSTSSPINQRIEKTNDTYLLILELIDELHIDEEERAGIILYYAQFCDKYALYDKAEELYLEHIDICEKMFGEEHPTTATSYNNIGLVYYNKGDYSKALDYFFKALKVNKDEFGENHPDTATNYNNIGLVYNNQGDYSKALDFYFKSLGISKKLLGEAHPSTAANYNNIGLIYNNQGNYQEALDFYFKALETNKKVYGDDHPETARNYNNIGLVFYNQYDYPKALDYYFKASEIYENKLGVYHPETAKNYNNIGLVYCKQGDYSKALEYNSKALEIYKKVFNIDNSDTARGYNNIGLVYYSRGDYSQALNCYSKALVIYDKVFGEYHSDTATIYNNIGLVYDNQDNYLKALEYFFRALAIYENENVFGVDHPYTATTYINIGLVYDSQSDYSKALNYYSKALEISKKVFGKDHNQTIEVREQIDVVKSKMSNS